MMSKVERYDLDADITRMVRIPNGDYVKYEDHERIVAELRTRIEELEFLLEQERGYQ